MKRMLIAAVLGLLLGGVSLAQSTTVSGTVSDTPDSQTWNNGTVTVAFNPNPNYPSLSSYTWTGGTINPTISGALSGTGTYSISVPSSTAISPQGSTWSFKFCPQPSVPCFNLNSVTVTGATQTLNATPPSIRINWQNPPGTVTAYADTEASTGASIGTTYFNLPSLVGKVCTAATGNTCTIWGVSGGGSIGAATNVKTLGAVGNGKFFIDGTSNSSNNQLTSATATFTASDVNQNISCTKNPLGPSALVAINSTVTAFVNSSTIVYGGANASNFANMYCALTNPADPAAILTAFNNCKTTFNAISAQQSFQAPACNVYFPAGVYGLSHTLSNFVSTGSEGCVGIIGDGKQRTVIIPTATFTQGGVVAGQIYDGRCVGALLRDFSIEMASIPTPNPGNTCGIISVSGTSTIQSVGVYDHSNLGGVGTLYGICAPTGGANVMMINPVVISGGAMAEGGLSITGSQGVVLNPFLSNTTQNLLITNAATGNNGNGLAILGGVIDEGSVTSIVNSQDVWITGTTLTGGANCISVDATSYVWLTGGYCGTFATNAGGGPTVASGGVLNMTQVHIRAQNAGNSCYTSAAYGGIVDDGTNNCTTAGGGTVYPAGGVINKTSLSHAQANAFQSGTLATTTNLMGFVVDQPIAIQTISWTPGNAFACTAGSFPTLSATDGTVTVTSSVNDTSSNGTVTHTFPNTTASVLNPAGTVGTQIRVAIVTTGTCGTAPTNTQVNVWWQATAPGL